MATRNRKGFTLIEILLVVVIMGIMLAVIVPRAYRANVDSKYNLVRQGASELAGYTRDWAEWCVYSQDERDGSTIKDYYDSLLTSPVPASEGTVTTRWVADTATTNNFLFTGTNGQAVAGRTVGFSGSTTPPGSVKSKIPIIKIPTNPFNGLNIFDPGNFPATLGVIPGALAMGGTVEKSDTAQAQYYFVYQGTDSTTTGLDATTTFFTIMNLSDLQHMRHGVFIDRAKGGAFSGGGGQG